MEKPCYCFKSSDSRVRLHSTADYVHSSADWRSCIALTYTAKNGFIRMLVSRTSDPGWPGLCVVSTSHTVPCTFSSHRWLNLLSSVL